MRLPHGEAAPSAPADAVADLAQQLRLLLDREGLTPRQLAAAPDVPYSTAMLYRFLTGESLPPPLLIDLITRTCGDSAGLRQAYKRARRAADVTGRHAGEPARKSRRGKAGKAGNATTGAATAGGGISGTGKAGNATAGSGTFEHATAGNVTAGSGALGNATAGNATAGSGTFEHATAGKPSGRRAAPGRRPGLIGVGVACSVAGAVALTVLAVGGVDRQGAEQTDRRPAPAAPSIAPPDPNASLPAPEQDSSARRIPGAQPSPLSPLPNDGQEGALQEAQRRAQEAEERAQAAQRQARAAERRARKARKRAHNN